MDEHQLQQLCGERTAPGYFDHVTVVVADSSSPNLVLLPTVKPAFVSGSTGMDYIYGGDGYLGVDGRGGGDVIHGGDGYLFVTAYNGDTITAGGGGSAVVAPADGQFTVYGGTVYQDPESSATISGAGYNVIAAAPQPQRSIQAITPAIEVTKGGAAANVVLTATDENGTPVAFPPGGITQMLIDGVPYTANNPRGIVLERVFVDNMTCTVTLSATSPGDITVGDHQLTLGAMGYGTVQVKLTVKPAGGN
jgi:hypothetical protein